MRLFKKCLLVLGILLLILSGYIIFRSDTFIDDASTNHGWNLMLVNHTNRIPDNYKVILTKLDNGKEVLCLNYHKCLELQEKMIFICR